MKLNFIFFLIFFLLLLPPGNSAQYMDLAIVPHTIFFLFAYTTLHLQLPFLPDGLLEQFYVCVK